LNSSASAAVARGRSVASRGSRLVNPPLVIGSVVPATKANPSTTTDGARPTAASSATADAASRNWLPANATSGRRVRSSHAPSSGPDTIDGTVYAATTAPASARFPVRANTNSTSASPTISSANRAMPADSR
jgi:hypothetical protein